MDTRDVKGVRGMARKPPRTTYWVSPDDGDWRVRREGAERAAAVFEDKAVAIELPQRITLEVVETEPVTKGQTASSSYKPAILSNGVRSAVPPHIGVGTRIVVMTADGSYVERAKD